MFSDQNFVCMPRHLHLYCTRQDLCSTFHLYVYTPSFANQCLGNKHIQIQLYNSLVKFRIHMKTTLPSNVGRLHYITSRMQVSATCGALLHETAKTCVLWARSASLTQLRSELAPRRSSSCFKTFLVLNQVHGYHNRLLIRIIMYYSVLFEISRLFLTCCHLPLLYSCLRP
jgi:hypothetical protein